jgi:hypothetical protein
VKQPEREADDLHLVPKLRMIEVKFLSSKSLHGVDSDSLASGSVAGQYI